MSEIMNCMPFSQLMDWVRTEHDREGSVFGVHRPYTAVPGKEQMLFGRKLEVPVGPAAGPHSQMAQNLAAAYYAGGRFFELKTVQVMDGAEMVACVNKPCIKADDEGYNCEWSTELSVPQAQDEYIKAWFLLSFLAKEYGLGDMDGFQFNISVGYDLEGIRSGKIDAFIENMKDARRTDVWKECREYLLSHAGEFRNMTREDIEKISPYICNSVTLSTLHGCPPQEIERIASYLLTEKKMHTFVKCNPTLLGYEFARTTLDQMGYGYLSFSRFHFEDDLQYADAVPMLWRLMGLAEKEGLEFGVKLTNTFPVDVRAGELPSEEMYMSGKALYPLSIALAAKLSGDFAGKLRISYSGGADALNLERICGCGIWPVTVATTLLKPGGYQRLRQLAERLETSGVWPFAGVDAEKAAALAKSAAADPHHRKAAKFPSSRKSGGKVPLIDCFTAPCEDACPIHQDVASYMLLAGRGDHEGAMQVILERNALPFITGTICSHTCMSHCTRNFYESPVEIRAVKLQCAEHAYEAALAKMKAAAPCGKRAAVVGGGPSGMAAAHYLAKGGAAVTLYEKRPVLGGIVSAVIPDFRIDDAVIRKDVSFLEKLGVDIRTGTEAPAVEELKDMGYDAVILAVGAYQRSALVLEGKTARNALDFLEEFQEKGGKLSPGKSVAVIGGGNTAMDTARAAKRCPGVEHVCLVYRRTRRYMPADEQELLLALEDGVEFRELLAPVRMEEGELICRKTRLGLPDDSGRAGVMETEEEAAIPADLVIAAVGEKVPTAFYEANGIRTDSRGQADVDEDLETNLKGVYVIGDGLYGPSNVVTGMAQAKKAAEAILEAPAAAARAPEADRGKIYEKKGVLAESGSVPEPERCLNCRTVCENCVDVCPNRANVSIRVPGMEKAQILHVDALCNECGNCRTFCPYESAPYLDKFTLFAMESDLAESRNEGFAVLDGEAGVCKVRLQGKEFIWAENGENKTDQIPEGLQELMKAVLKDHRYLLGEACKQEAMG